ncbi:MAG TPA: acetamidase/formamidase family protein [Opitutaceae bacterium]|nr:acetamidase/formamidase family protein [Opitutaceae bacterium]
MRTLLSGAVALAFVASSAGTRAADFDHHLKVTIDTAVFGYYAAETPPVLTIKSGERVKIDTVSLSGIPDDPETFYREQGISTDNAAIQDIIALKSEAKKRNLTLRGPLTGPIAVEGAEPGDTLEVRVLSLKFRANYGINSTRPGGTGPLSDLVPRPWQQVYRIDPARHRAIFSPTIEMPLQPHLGQMGVAPPAEMGRLRSGPPTMVHGGNFDLREITVGSSLYLPVSVKGGIFTTGDPHALQGNGEVTGFTIECNIEGILQFIVHKATGLKVPRIETPTHYIAIGIHDELDGAMRAATLEAQAFLKEKEGMDFFTSYSFLSMGADFCVTRALKPGQMIHVMIPKSHFLAHKNTYWYRPPSPGIAALATP